MRGFTNRQPSVVSSIVRGPRSHAPSALSITYGARVIDSTPPATNTSPSPAPIACAALFTAWRPEPHSRFTVCPATSTGSPARRAAMRATLRLSSPRRSRSRARRPRSGPGRSRSARRSRRSRRRRDRRGGRSRARRRSARSGSGPRRRSRPPGAGAGGHEPWPDCGTGTGRTSPASEGHVHPSVARPCPPPRRARPRGGARRRRLRRRLVGPPSGPTAAPSTAPAASEAAGSRGPPLPSGHHRASDRCRRHRAAGGHPRRVRAARDGDEPSCRSSRSTATAGR